MWRFRAAEIPTSGSRRLLELVEQAQNHPGVFLVPDGMDLIVIAPWKAGAMLLEELERNAGAAIAILRRQSRNRVGE